MIPDAPSGRWLDRLERLQRFYDGPVPAPERRWIFADPDPAVRSASETWNALAQESEERARGLRTAIFVAASPGACKAVRDALRAERAWGRHCRARSRAEAAQTGRSAISRCSAVPS